MSEAKILLFDIETSPMKGYVWGLWNNNLAYDSQVVQDWYVLCWAAKWLDNKEVVTSALPDYKSHYKKDPEDDYHVVKALWDKLDEADIVIAHNGDKFDIKKIQARFMFHKLPPPSPFKSVDTLKAARNHFKFSSNRLDHLGDMLGVGRKVQTGGMKLWTDCIDGKELAWKKMVKYNIQDIKLLEKVYLLLRPWMANHPSVVIYNDSDKVQCSKCGHDKIQWRGYYHTNTQRYHRFQCKKCKGWGRARTRAEQLTNKTVDCNRN